VPETYNETSAPYTVCWGNGFRGGGWDGSTMLSGPVNNNITLIVTDVP
jgi:hypothetical protein